MGWWDSLDTWDELMGKDWKVRCTKQGVQKKTKEAEGQKKTMESVNGGEEECEMQIWKINY